MKEKKQMPRLEPTRMSRTIWTMKFCITLIMVTTVQLSHGQQIALTFKEAEKQGISMQHLDSIYKSAVSSDTTNAVFKTTSEQDNLQQSYAKLLQDLGDYLSKSNFKWEKRTQCFNKIYFNNDGTIDYFLFFFRGNEEDNPSKAQQEEFQRLLNLFIKDYKFSLTANTKFSQCGGAVYLPE